MDNISVYRFWYFTDIIQRAFSGVPKGVRSAMLRSGDTLVVKSLDRLSRNKADIKNELQYFKEHGIRLKVLDLPTTMIDYPAGQEWVLPDSLSVIISLSEAPRETNAASCRSRFCSLLETLAGNLEQSQRKPLWSRQG